MTMASHLTRPAFSLSSGWLWGYNPAAGEIFPLTHGWKTT